MYSVTAQQVFLRTYFNYYKGTIDGKRGPKMIAAIKSYQKGQRLTADGVWGAKTDACARSNVRGVQSQLRKAGYKSVVVDGVIGAKTVAAILAYQKAHKALADDGIMGMATYKSLFAVSTIKKTTKTTVSSLPSGYISAHFKKIEFKCGCGGRYCDGYNGKNVNPKLIRILEGLRSHYGKPITITSGIRCQRYNDSLRGSIKNSVHRLGGAADIYIPGVTTTAAGRAQVKALAYKLGAAYCYYGTKNMGNAVHINV